MARSSPAPTRSGSRSGGALRRTPASATRSRPRTRSGSRSSSWSRRRRATSTATPGCGSCLPIRPNGAAGWVRMGAVTVHKVPAADRRRPLRQDAPLLPRRPPRARLLRGDRPSRNADRDRDVLRLGAGAAGEPVGTVRRVRARPLGVLAGAQGLAGRRPDGDPRHRERGRSRADGVARLRARLQRRHGRRCAMSRSARPSSSRRDTPPLSRFALSHHVGIRFSFLLNEERPEEDGPEGVMSQGQVDRHDPRVGNLPRTSSEAPSSPGWIAIFGQALADHERMVP